MLHIKSLDEGLSLFKTLGSNVCIQIINLLLQNKEMNMNELATELNITNGALTGYIKKLEDAGLISISISSEVSGHGNQKKCSVHLDKILIDFDPQNTTENIFQTELKVVQYSDYSVYPTCGLASSSKLIGEVNDARYFAHPDRYNADILWFTKGYVEYIIPNFIPTLQKIDQISNVTIEDFNFDYKSTIKFKFAVPDTAHYVGGLTIFGKNFGNYNQDINVRMSYSPIK